MTAPQPHTRSYYAATANSVAGYPPLTGDQRADVCVIGAGFTGLSAGLALAERGYDVRILEANRVGWGASGRNGGQMIGGSSGEHRLARSLGPNGDRLLWNLRWAGHELIRGRIERYGIRCDLKTGYADVAIKPRHVRELQEEYDYLARHDAPFEFRLLGCDETRDTIGSPAFIGALVNMGNGHVHPLNLCLGEANAAVQQGATIHEGSLVTRIQHGDKPKVATQHGSVTADFVIIAGNAYHTVEKRLRDIMLPVNSYIIATEPLLPQQIASVNPLDLAICNPNFVIEYFRLSADKRMLFGGRCNYVGDDPRIITNELRPRMLRVFPQLADLPIEFAWGGRMGIPLNRVPQFGRLAPNVFYAQGYSGHGVNMTHLAGEILADVVAGTSERFDLFARLRTWRIPGAHLFPTPLVKLGVAYYQLRDWL